MVKASRSISLEIDTWKALEELSKRYGKSVSEIIEDLVNREVNKSENG